MRRLSSANGLSLLPINLRQSFPGISTSSSLIDRTKGFHLSITSLLLSIITAVNWNGTATCFPFWIYKPRAYVVSGRHIIAGNCFSFQRGCASVLLSIHIQVSLLTFAMNATVLDLPTGRITTDTGRSPSVPFSSADEKGVLRYL